MPRVKRGTHRRASRKKTLRLASGYFLTKSKLYRAAQEVCFPLCLISWGPVKRQPRDKLRCAASFIKRSPRFVCLIPRLGRRPHLSASSGPLPWR